MRKKVVGTMGMLSAVMAMGLTVQLPVCAMVENGWEIADGNMYWYEGGVKQGTEGRGKEIYDPGSNAWYWLDAVDGGRVAKSKDVYQESQADDAGTIGKWVRYDSEGHMVKGWSVTEAGTYYFDLTYGTMAKGSRRIDDVDYVFNEGTGIMEGCGISLENHWETIEGKQYWYEAGVRQGYNPMDASYRGKEIYDPGSDAWYWLDNVQQGAKAVSKDVYQESQADDAGNIGKWVRYDAEGHMVKGWSTNENGTYYFDPVYGTMAKGTITIDGKVYKFDEESGVCTEENKPSGGSGTEGENKPSGNPGSGENGPSENNGRKEYDSDGRLVKEYDANGNLVKEYDYNFSSGIHQEYYYGDDGYWYKMFEYDADGNVRRHIDNQRDGNGKLISLEYDADGKVTLHEEYQHDENGNTIKKSEFDANGNVIKELEYDADGKTIREVHYDADGKIMYQNQYDKNGKWTNVYFYDEAGKVTGWREEQHDENGHIMKGFYYDADGIMRSEYEYDENNHQIGRYQYYYHENGTIRSKVHYDEKTNKQTEGISYNEDGTVSGETQYDENENRIKHVSYRYDENAEVCYTEEYEYDEHGNVVKHISYNRYGTLIDESFKYEYDSDGNMLRKDEYERTKFSYNKQVLVKSTFYTADGKVTREEKHSQKAIEGNNYVEWTNYDENGNVTDRSEAQKLYDPDWDGDLIKLVYYDAGGKETGWSIYVYSPKGDEELETVIHYNAGGEKTGQEKYSYRYVDGYPKLVKVVSYDANGNAISEKNYE